MWGEQAGEGERGVTHQFGFDAPTALTRDLAVVGIADEQVAGDSRGLAVGFAQDRSGG